jgi:dethiobiotin synthase
VLRGLFVTGTDTGVGKTVAAAALVHRYRGLAPLRYWKPVQTGIEQDDDTAEVRRLSGCQETGVLPPGICLAKPLSPHHAAHLAGRSIDLQALTASIFAQPSSDRWIVEGAGGVLVPLTETAFIADLIALLGLPVLVVARSRLGTINHTLLTLEALRARALTVAAVVMVGEKHPENRAAIERYGGVSVVGEMPWFPELSPQSLARWAGEELDPAGDLLNGWR